MGRVDVLQDGQGRAYKGVVDTARRVYTEEGVAKLFSGIGPRVMWISIGGFIFFGVYEDCRLLIRRTGL